jgi:CDP-diacylglycerol--glycerol-3-phosphate 3-phosphatidyltransferase
MTRTVHGKRRLGRGGWFLLEWGTMNLPNQLTVARLVMALAFVGLMSFPSLATYLTAYVLFILATITDYYDGKIARERNLITNFGKLLDPVADKVLLVGALIMLMQVPGLRVPSWCIVAIIAREFLVTGARSLAASEGVVIPANIWGKTKAVIQMVYVFLFLALAIIGDLLDAAAPVVNAEWWSVFLTFYHMVVGALSFWAIIFVALFTIYAGFQFMRVNWRAMNLGNHNE